MDDAVFTALRTVIEQGWQQTKAELFECVRPYFDRRDQLTIQGKLVYKGH